MKPVSNGENENIQARWSRLGPYYAMFPYKYAKDVICKYTKPEDAVLDPFAGRFTSTVAASYLGRLGVGIEINPLGYLYGRAKIFSAQRYGDVLRRIEKMAVMSGDYRKKAQELDEFFHMCYCKKVLCFLLACKYNLNWKKSCVDATLMAQILTSMHHERYRGLSNQMRQTKSMAPQYSINWWKNNGFKEPPEINPKDFLIERLKWRYKYGAPAKNDNNCIYLKDSASFLDKMPPPHCKTGKFKLLFTSPPYYNLVNYHKDQWLRLWMLGGNPYPKEDQHVHKKRFSNKNDYKALLDKVFQECAKLMDKKSIIVVRTDSREYTYRITQDVLSAHFPSHRIMKSFYSVASKNQSKLFNKINNGIVGEQDLILKS